MKPNGQNSPSMNGKAYEGLTLPGLAAHIASSILLWKKGQGTINDCKHAIAHNVRAFQRRLIAEKEIEIWVTWEAVTAEKKQIELEHAIPVGCLMNLLFYKVETFSPSEAAVQVDELLRENTVLVWVTKDEHAELNKCYQCKMPNGFDTYPWRDKLARYTQTPRVSKLSEWVGLTEKTKPAESDLDAEIEGDF